MTICIFEGGPAHGHAVDIAEGIEGVIVPTGTIPGAFGTFEYRRAPYFPWLLVPADSIPSSTSPK